MAPPLVSLSPPVSNPMSRRIIGTAAAAMLLFAQTCAARALHSNMKLERRDPTFGFPYGSTKIRGVNLG